MGKADGKKDYKFVQIEVLLGDNPVILEPRAPSAGYSVFPIISFQPHGKESLAALALPAAVLANKFAKALDERSDIANHPPIAYECCDGVSATPMIYRLVVLFRLIQAK